MIARSLSYLFGSNRGRKWRERPAFKERVPKEKNSHEVYCSMQFINFSKSSNSLSSQFHSVCCWFYHIINVYVLMHELPQNAVICTGKSCGRLSDIKNGVLTYKNGTLYGDKAVYECNEGYSLSGGENERLCNANGLWNGTEPFCIGRRHKWTN